MPSVQDSAELRRILAIPRRVYTDADADRLVDLLTSALKTPHGTMRLMRHQAIALAEIAQYGGAFLPLPVGAGKTLISFLAPVVYASMRGVPVHRPLLVIKASLLDKTNQDEIDLRQHWTLPPFMRKITYEKISRATSADFFRTYDPDFLIADEAHAWKNVKASSSRKGLRFLNERTHVPFVVLTGSPIGTSIKDTAHLMSRALGHMSPLPRNYIDVTEWACAIDVEARNPFDEGALALLAQPGEDVRIALQRRIVETPGVVTMRGVTIDTPITIRSHVRDIAPEQIEALTNLRKLGQTPDGELAEDSLAIARHASELALGFYSTWDPRPPAEWLARRRAWHSICRDVLDANQREIDSAEQLTLHLARHPEHYPEAARAWRSWKEIEPEYTRTPVARWFSDHTLRWCLAWLEKDRKDIARGGSILWTNRPAFGLRLAELSGLPYFGEEGIDVRTGARIGAARGQILASSGACGTGHNLQSFARNLCLDIPRSPILWEQRIGRTHRPGQRAALIEVDLAFGIIEDAIRFESACAHALNAQLLEGQPKKLCLADVTDVDQVAELVQLPGPQWQRPRKRS